VIVAMPMIEGGWCTARCAVGRPRLPRSGRGACQKREPSDARGHACRPL